MNSLFLIDVLLSKLSPMKEPHSLPVRILSSKIWNDISNKLFGDKLVVDERNAILSFTWPWTDLKCHVLPPYLSFYTQLTLLFVLQTAVLFSMGVFLYKFTVISSKRTKSTKYLVSFGFLLPIILYEPIYIIQILGIENRALRMFLLALPINASLRLLEATFGFLPTGADTSLNNFLSYFACLMGCKFDEKTHDPIRVSKSFLLQQSSKLLLNFGLVMVLMSCLAHRQYEFMNVPIPSHSLDHTFNDLFSWNHLINNYLVTLLLSLTLTQSSIGVSLMYNIVFQNETYDVVRNPLFSSKSPSDFWKNRWNILVHSGLKNGIYKPLLQRKYSKGVSAIIVFAVSGILHEYVDLVMFAGSSFETKWKHMMFFLWNSVLIVAENFIGHMSMFHWTKNKLPTFLVSTFVVLTALPLGHLFLGEWIQHGYFDSVAFAEPIIICA